MIAHDHTGPLPAVFRSVLLPYRIALPLTRRLEVSTELSTRALWSTSLILPFIMRDFQPLTYMLLSPCRSVSYGPLRLRRRDHPPITSRSFSIAPPAHRCTSTPNQDPSANSTSPYWRISTQAPQRSVFKFSSFHHVHTACLVAPMLLKDD